MLSDDCLAGTVFLGELGLDGRIRAVPGVLPSIAAAAGAGFARVVVPVENAAEAAVSRLASSGASQGPVTLPLVISPDLGLMVNARYAGRPKWVARDVHMAGSAWISRQDGCSRTTSA